MCRANASELFFVEELRTSCGGSPFACKSFRTPPALALRRCAGNSAVADGITVAGACRAMSLQIVTCYETTALMTAAAFAT